MIITCQNCQTHYSVDVNALGGGKAVQCGNCGNSWHQGPVQAPPPMAIQPLQAPQPVYAEQMAPAQPMQPAPPPPPEPIPEPAPEPEPEPEPEPVPEPEPEPEPEVAEEVVTEEAEAPEQEAPGGTEEDALSSEQLDEMFGEDTETDAFFAGDDAGGDEGEAEAIDPEQIPEPEPIPQVFSADDGDTAVDADAKKGGKGKIIGIAAAVVLIALGAGVFFGRGFIIDLWPPAADYYAMAGLGGEELGAGLDIRNVKSSREVEGGVDVLVVRGTVANIAEEERKVPMIRVSLYDGEGEEVQHVIAAPLKSRIPPGAKIGFKAKLSQPSALARRLEVTFSEEMKPGS